jgi:diadenosine tetraphosphate (Ap4A) HIT family hydrolase
MEPWNKPVFESPNFVVLPSLGALVEGWLLLVPKEHFICMGAVPEPLTSEMEEVKDIIISALQQTYGQVCAFEHGPSATNLSIGCGVDHAHLHIVPLSFDLVSAASSFLPQNLIWSEAGFKECRKTFGRGEDYLYLEQPVGVGRIAVHREFGGQLFRRAISAHIGVPNQFNWREYSQLSNVSATIKKLREMNGGLLRWLSRRKVAA